MAGITITPNQENLIRKKTNVDSSLLDLSHRHPSIRSSSLRWTMGRMDDTPLSNGKTYMQWWVNPRECQWRMATRTTIEKISGGIVHHEWPQTGIGANGSMYGSRYDQPVLSMSFQSGIITPGGYEDILSGAEPSSQLPHSLGNFFDFLNLLDRPDATSTGEPNYINILYASPVFGQKGIRLQGFFTEEGVSWTDSAESPNQINSWGATFMVFNMYPRLDSLLNNFELIGIPVSR